MLIPVVILLGLSMLKVPALPSMAAGTLSAVLIAVLVQGKDFVSVIGTLYSGHKIESGVAAIDSLLITP